MKNTVLIIAGILLVSMTSYGSNKSNHESRTSPESSDHHRATITEGYSYEISTANLSLASDEIPRAFDRIDLSESIEKSSPANVEVTANDELEEKVEQLNSSCQDTIYLVDGRVIPITVISQTDMTVKYKKCDDPINRTWRKDSRSILKIVYSNGETRTYAGSRTNNNGENYHKKKQGTIAFIALGIIGALVLLFVLAAVAFFTVVY